MKLATVREAIRSELSALTKIDFSTIDDRTNFVDFGLDSILILQLIVRIEIKFCVVIAPRDLYSATTVEELANLILVKSGQTQ